MIKIVKSLPLMVGLITDIQQSKAQQAGLDQVNLQDFNKQFFWNKPDDGLYEVDIGLQGNFT